jgi:hypothetical protein
MYRIRLSAEQVQLELVANGLGDRLPFQVIGPITEPAFVEELIEEEFGGLTINPKLLFGFLSQDSWIRRFFQQPMLIEGDLDATTSAMGSSFSSQTLGNKIVQAGVLNQQELDQLLDEYRPFAETQRFGEFPRLNLQVPPQILDLLLNPAAFLEQGLNEKRLGERLLDLGAISQTQLDEALALHAKNKGRIGEILAELGYIPPTMARFFSMVKMNEKGQLDYSHS